MRKPKRNKIYRIVQTLLLIAGLYIAVACGAHYIVNSSIPLIKESFSPDKKTGVAVFGNATPGLYQTITAQINSFAERNLTFADVTSGVTLNQDRTVLESVQELSDQYPDMQYILIVWQHPPEISKNYSTFREGSNFTDPNTSAPLKASRDVTYYTTTFKLKCETLLFDLRQKSLVAKAIDTFSKTETRKDEHWFKNKTLLGTVEDIFDSGLNKSKYPDVRFLDPQAFWSYFKHFLKNIGKK
jgi:hypothetical protein